MMNLTLDLGDFWGLLLGIYFLDILKVLTDQGDPLQVRALLHGRPSQGEEMESNPATGRPRRLTDLGP